MADNTMVKIFRHEPENKEMYIPFEEIRKGDTVYVKDGTVVAADDAHYSGDADYDGYLFYDVYGNGIFPEDVKPAPFKDMNLTISFTPEVVEAMRKKLGMAIMTEDDLATAVGACIEYTLMSNEHTIAITKEKE